MGASQGQLHLDSDAGRSVPERLECGELVHFPTCPFALPEGPDLTFLFDQQTHSLVHKNISFNPLSGRVTGSVLHSQQQGERLRALMSDFSRRATTWLASVLPRYAGCWQLDRASLRNEEEATRKLRLTARDDLLHIDAFPSRPTRGYRILRLYVNINLTEPRVWMTSETFAKLLSRFGNEVGLPSATEMNWARRLGEGLLGIFHPGRRQRTVYDDFMLRLHNFLKHNDEFQERGPKRFWTFAPGSAWLLFTDTLSHAALRGRFALEHSYFVAPETLLLPQQSPAALLEQACGIPVLGRAA